MAKILIGTCGYDYDDWGAFYPHDIGENEYPYYYAGQFPTKGSCYPLHEWIVRYAAPDRYV